MKIRFLIIFLFCAFSSLGQDRFEYNKAAEYSIDLDDDNNLDRIKIYTVKDWNDPGELQRIEFEFSALDNAIIDGIEPAYQKFENYQFLDSTDIENLVDSNLIYVFNANGSAYVFLFGYAYASSPGILTIFKVDSSSFTEVFNDEFDLTKVEIENNRVLMIGRSAYAATFGKLDNGYEKRAYAPYLIYELNDSIKLLDSATETYNIENYAGYFGAKYRTDKPILHKAGKKPVPFFTQYRKYPESSLRRLTVKDLSDYSKKELRIMRNEIFADYGRKFNSKDLQDYFNQQNWYEPKHDYVSDKLTDIEKANIKLIIQIETNKRG